MDYYNLFQDDQNTFSPLIYFGLTKEDILVLAKAHLEGKTSIRMLGRNFIINYDTFQIYTNNQVFNSSEGVRLYFNNLKKWRTPNQFLEDDLIIYGDNVTREIFTEIKEHGNNIEIPNNETTDFLWSLIHDQIKSVSQKLYNDGHCKEAVQAASVEVISRVKQINKVKKGKRLDGKPLMMNVFDEDNPIIKVVSDDIEDAKGIQEGYKFLFGGLVLAVRNPIAHKNFKIENIDAIELLFLCSRLMRKLDEADIHYISELLAGKWKNEWENNEFSESQLCEITSDLKYLIDGVHCFDINDLKVNYSLDGISFIKSSVISGDDRLLNNELKIKNNSLLEGNEGQYKITYTRIG